MLSCSPETIPQLAQEYPAWHRGRTTYCLWLIELDDPVFPAQIEAARTHLSGLLHEPYLRQPHITLFVCGFLANTLRFDDDFSSERFREQELLLRDAKIEPFRIDIGGLDSFSTAPFLQVVDRDGGIYRARDILSHSGGEVARDAFIPHVTVGLYAGAFRSGEVMRRISRFPRDPFTYAVRRITFATYQARELAGALTYRCAVPLVPA